MTEKKKPPTVWRGDGSWIPSEAINEKETRPAEFMLSEKGAVYQRLPQALEEPPRLTKEEENRRRKLEQARITAIQWQDPDRAFLERQLLLASKAERERTLKYYLCEAHEGLRRAFLVQLVEWILDRLDKLNK